MSRLGRGSWIRAASAAIGERGVEGVKVEVLAKALGVSKGSFYWHFENRAALLTAVLTAWEEAGTSAIIDDVEQHASEPRDKLWRLIQRVFHTDLPFGNFELQVRAWAQSDPEAEAVVRRVDRRRLAYVRDRLREAGVPADEAKRRAELMYRTLVGEMGLRAYGSKRLPEASLRFLWDAILR
ncbi:MAG: TetR/AcrR family transcriptional regulator [Polyangiaceae bacterium]